MVALDRSENTAAKCQTAANKSKGHCAMAHHMRASSGRRDIARPGSSMLCHALEQNPIALHDRRWLESL